MSHPALLYIAICLTCFFPDSFGCVYFDGILDTTIPDIERELTSSGLGARGIQNSTPGVPAWHWQTSRLRAPNVASPEPGNWRNPVVPITECGLDKIRGGLILHLMHKKWSFLVTTRIRNRPGFVFCVWYPPTSRPWLTFWDLETCGLCWDSFQWDVNVTTCYVSCLDWLSASTCDNTCKLNKNITFHSTL